MNAPIADQARLVIYAMAKRAVFLGDLIVMREVILLSGIGTEAERQHTAGEWDAQFHKRAYSIWPRYAAPRFPRPLGLEDDE